MTKLFISLIFYCLYYHIGFSQDTFNAFDPIQVDKAKEDWEKIKKTIVTENENKSQQSQNLPGINKQPNSQLDELIQTLQPVTNPHLSTNPATSNIAPKGVYNTSDESKILIDEVVFEGKKSYDKSSNSNESNLLIAVIVMGISILGLVIYVITKK
jgi:hypothetical protein